MQKLTCSPRELVWILYVAVLVSAGCCGLEEGDVQREWNRTMRELGINPVYPPREDLQVGDVYVRRCNVNKPEELPHAGLVPIDLWVANVAQGADVKAFYETRSLLPDTDATGSQAAGAPHASGDALGVLTKVAKGVPPDAAGDKSSVFTAGRATALRQVAFPDFASVSVTGANLRGSVPVEALAVAFGAEWSDAQQLDVRIPLAESYGLPATMLLPCMVEAPGGVCRIREDFLPAAYLRILKRGQKEAVAGDPNLSDDQREQILADASLYLDVVTEVYYTRRIEMALSRSSELGAQADVEPLGASAVEGILARPDDGAGAEGEKTAAPSAFDRAKALNERLGAGGQSQAVGGHVQFTSVSEHSISMRRTYERPIAIGYRSLLLAVDPDNGAVLAMGAASVKEAVTTAGETFDAGAAIAKAVQAELGGTASVSRKVGTPALVLSFSGVAAKDLLTVLSSSETRVRIAEGIRKCMDHASRENEKLLDAFVEAIPPIVPAEE